MTTDNADRDTLTAMVNDLPPTDYLVMDVLAGRYRAGENAWTFPKRLTPSLRRLETAGLVWWKSGPVEHTCLAGLTDTGRDAVLSPTYVAPADEETEQLRTRVHELTAQLAQTRSALADAYTEALVDASAALVAALNQEQTSNPRSRDNQILLDRLQQKMDNVRTVINDDATDAPSGS